jgi:hypothetical protein
MCVFEKEERALERRSSMNQKREKISNNKKSKERAWGRFTWRLKTC